MKIKLSSFIFVKLILFFLSIAQVVFAQSFEEAKSLFKQRKYEASKQMLQSIFDTASNKAEIYSYLGGIGIRTSNLIEGRENYRRMLHYSEESSIDYMNGLKGVGICNSIMFFNDSAFQYMKEALATLEKVEPKPSNYLQLKAGLYNNIAIEKSFVFNSLKKEVVEVFADSVKKKHY